MEGDYPLVFSQQWRAALVKLIGEVIQQELATAKEAAVAAKRVTHDVIWLGDLALSWQAVTHVQFTPDGVAGNENVGAIIVFQGGSSKRVFHEDAEVLRRELAGRAEAVSDALAGG